MIRKTWLITAITSIFTASAFGQHDIWTRHAIDDSYSGADGVRLADVNDDGLQDICTGWEETGYTIAYLHPGYDKVKEAWPSVNVGVTPSVEDAVFFDFDHNGVFDITSCSEGKDRKIYFNIAPTKPGDYLDSTKWVSKALPASTDITMWMFAVPVQIDGKNGVDLVAGSKGHDAKIGWFESPKNPEKLEDWVWHPMSDATWIMSIFPKDMDGDGDLDIVTSDRKKGATNGIRWLENPGKKGVKKPWNNHFIGAQGLEVMFMDLADLDQDGLEDALTTEYTNQQIHFFKRLDKTGTHWKDYPIQITANTGRSKSVRVGDIDMDGKPDIVHSTETNEGDKSGVWWLSYQDSPTEADWTWHNISGPDGIKYDRIELLDLDGDSDLDVLICEENFGDNSEGLGVVWYENPFR
ncbi:MAG: FG-GAP repeat domain-containing protein [Bacteroidota bacterium]